MLFIQFERALVFNNCHKINSWRVTISCYSKETQTTTTVNVRYIQRFWTRRRQIRPYTTDDTQIRIEFLTWFIILYTFVHSDIIAPDDNIWFLRKWAIFFQVLLFKPRTWSKSSQKSTLNQPCLFVREMFLQQVFVDLISAPFWKMSFIVVPRSLLWRWKAASAFFDSAANSSRQNSALPGCQSCQSSPGPASSKVFSKWFSKCKLKPSKVT